MTDALDQLDRLVGWSSPHKKVTAGPLAEVLHREDVTGRAIHEDAYAMQVPSFPASECGACNRAASAILAALAAPPD